MESIEGSPEEIYAAALRELAEPVATLPSAGLCWAFCRALERVEEASARALLAPDARRRLDWRTQALAADHRHGDDARLALRTGRVTDTVVAGRERAYALDTTTAPPTAVAARVTGRRPAARRWTLGERVRFDTPPATRVVAETRDRVGDTAARAVAQELRREPARRGGPGIDPVKLLLWAGAAEGARLAPVRDVIRRLGLAGDDPVAHRLDALADEHLVTVPGDGAATARDTDDDATPRADDGENGDGGDDGDGGDGGGGDVETLDHRRRLAVAAGLAVDDPARPPEWVRAGLV